MHISEIRKLNRVIKTHLKHLVQIGNIFTIFMLVNLIKIVKNDNLVLRIAMSCYAGDSLLRPQSLYHRDLLASQVRRRT